MHFSLPRCLRTLHPVLVLCLLLGLNRHAAAWPTVYPTGTTVNDTAAARNGYILFCPLGQGGEASTLYLINLRGEVVHTWSVPFSPMVGRLLPNGNIVVLGRNDRALPGRPGVKPYEIGGAAGWLVELTWEGKLVFKHVDLAMHHDFAKLPNGHYIYLAWERVPPALHRRVQGGIKGSEFKDGTMFNDCLVEVDATGHTVWEWHANAHLDPARDVISPILKREEWLHSNSVALTASGNILVSNRHTDSFFVVERATGRVALRWGNAAYYDAATRMPQLRQGATTLGGPHDAQEIAAGLPGAGHLLCYDNGIYTGSSRVVEVDPRTRALVREIMVPGLGRKHFSNFVGGAQRLQGGNTLVCDGANGRFFQITPAGRIVWEYVNPMVPNPLYQGAVFKIRQYEPDFCPQLAALAR